MDEVTASLRQSAVASAASRPRSLSVMAHGRYGGGVSPDGEGEGVRAGEARDEMQRAAYAWAAISLLECADPPHLDSAYL